MCPIAGLGVGVVWPRAKNDKEVGDAMTPITTFVTTFVMNRTNDGNSNRLEASDNETQGLSFTINIKTLDCHHHPSKE
ncbi:hypothetical protein DEO72_LG5g515 [Vigna unguiculata]|uniref:Uncharacterized protein n=1 Tax=Vigna unguiculata TaxID=3917 RepID=A0A4D6LU32_VIGUN|nr:hypothetical protein DEO72_LG5g515 [Vigna unguiculata]